MVLDFGLNDFLIQEMWTFTPAPLSRHGSLEVEQVCITSLVVQCPMHNYNYFNKSMESIEYILQVRVKKTKTTLHHIGIGPDEWFY